MGAGARPNLRADSRKGVSTFVETFILLGIAIGGAGIAVSAAERYASTLQGPSVSISNLSIRQGAYAAIEEVEVTNTGDTTVDSFVLSTTGINGTADFCYSVSGANERVSQAPSCPAGNPGPASITVQFALDPGQGVLDAVTVEGAPFKLGATESLTIVTSTGAEQTAEVVVGPA